jgi:regulator of RNase E activity RraB
MDIHNQDVCHFIYALREREFIKSKENIIKIGKTKQHGLSRFNSYPNGSQLLLHIICSDCDLIERILIEKFKIKYLQQLNIGIEYFQGDPIFIIQDILYEVDLFDNKKKEKIMYPEKKINFKDYSYKEDEETNISSSFIKKNIEEPYKYKFFDFRKNMINL